MLQKKRSIFIVCSLVYFWELAHENRLLIILQYPYKAKYNVNMFVMEQFRNS